MEKHVACPWTRLLRWVWCHVANSVLLRQQNQCFVHLPPKLNKIQMISSVMVHHPHWSIRGVISLFVSVPVALLVFGNEIKYVTLLVLRNKTKNQIRIVNYTRYVCLKSNSLMQMPTFEWVYSKTCNEERTPKRHVLQWDWTVLKTRHCSRFTS